MEASRKEIIENYLIAYNQIDIEGMLKDLHPEIHFQNITSEVVDLDLKGIEAFKTQAEEAKTYFSERRIVVKAWRFESDLVKVSVDYEAILAIDLPNGLSAGDSLGLEGESEYAFKDGKIIKIVDRS